MTGAEAIALIEIIEALEPAAERLAVAIIHAIKNDDLTAAELELSRAREQAAGRAIHRESHLAGHGGHK